MHFANSAIDAVHNFTFLQKVVDKAGLLSKNPPVTLAGDVDQASMREALTHAFLDKLDCLSPARKERSSKGLLRSRLGRVWAGLPASTANSPEKRYWWERGCNTAHADGEESVSASNGFRVSTVSSQGWLKVFLGYCWERLSAARNL
jgi:hypothetical protein